MQSLFYIFLGGGAGSLCRYGLTEVIGKSDRSFSWGTLVANILACLILGIIIGYESKTNLKMNHKLLLATGFCGGFSTFSTFSADFVKHINDGELSLAFLYIALSLISGIVALFIGIKLIHLI